MKALVNYHIKKCGFSHHFYTILFLKVKSERFLASGHIHPSLVYIKGEFISIDPRCNLG